MLKNWVLSTVLLFFFLTLLSSVAAISHTNSLSHTFYRRSCPQAEGIIRILMSRLYFRNPEFPAVLIRLYFHDCFSQGCDASVLLDAAANDDGSFTSEKKAGPNLTLKGFEEIDQIKAALERWCPHVVSCADILTIATRDAVVLSGGPFYPVAKGRRDSTKAFVKEATEELPGPDDSIDHILNLFAAKGFDERDMVSLLGAHNIGKIGCDFISNRLDNFSGTGQPDESIDPTYLEIIRSKCEEKEGSNSNQASQLSMSYSKHLFSSLALKGVFSTQFYKSLLHGRGLIFSDQQLMANEKTARLVRTYASDFGLTFRMDFSKAMRKLSVFNVLTGSEGVIRETCRS